MLFGQPDSSNTQRLEQLRSLIEAESGDGLQLLTSLTNNPICSIHLDETVPCIAVAWKRYATSTQFRYVHESIIPLLKRHQVHLILDDDTLLPTIHAEDQRWVINDWMPRAAAAGLRAAVSIRPAAYFGRLAVERIRSQTCSGVAMRCFDELKTAWRWLQSLLSQ